MTYRNMVLPYIYLIFVWFANINDLIRGHWFFYTTKQIIIWNILGILSMIVLILNSADKSKDDIYCNAQRNCKYKVYSYSRKRKKKII